MATDHDPQQHCGDAAALLMDVSGEPSSSVPQRRTRGVAMLCAVGVGMISAAAVMRKTASPTMLTANSFTRLDAQAEINKRTLPIPESSAATIGDAGPFKNIAYATLGYNIYYSDPLPVLPKGAEKTVTGEDNVMDTGFTKKPVFDVTYDSQRLTGDRRHTQPDGFHVTVDQGCATSFVTEKIRDMYEYEQMTMKKGHVSARAELAVAFPPAGKGKKKKVSVGGKAFARVGGSLSYQHKAIEKTNRLSTSYMYRSDAKCAVYTVGIDYETPPPTHPEFAQAVSKASGTEDFYKLFDDFGTHMNTVVKMGARSGSSVWIKKASASSAHTTANGFGVSLEASVGAVVKLSVTKSAGKSGGIKKAVKAEAKINLLTPSEKKSAEAVQQSIDEVNTGVVGAPIPEEGADYWLELVKEQPVPIEVEQQPICQHPEFTDDVKIQNCVSSLETYCEDHLKAKGASCSATAKTECYNDLDCNGVSEVCREFQCIALPKCQVTIYSNQNYGGSYYNLPEVDAKSSFDGETFKLSNGDWLDKISSIKLSEGCLKVELVDDDGPCHLGKAQNRVTYSSLSKLIGDLDNDVCMLKIWARPPLYGTPQVGKPAWLDLRGKKARRAGSPHQDSGAINGDLSTSSRGGNCVGGGYESLNENDYFEVDLGSKYQIKQVDIVNRGDHRGRDLRFFSVLVDGSACVSDMYLDMGERGSYSCPEGMSGSKIRVRTDQHGAVKICELMVKVEPSGRRLAESTISDWPVSESTPSTSPVFQNSSTRSLRARASRRLGDAGEYLPNIGKAMYGYNTFYGAPHSVANAGSDPGFQKRPIWDVSYESGAKSKYTDLKEELNTDDSANPAPSCEHPVRKVEFVRHEKRMEGQKDPYWYNTYYPDEAESLCLEDDGCKGLTCRTYCRINTEEKLYDKERSNQYAMVKQVVEVCESEGADAVATPAVFFPHDGFTVTDQIGYEVYELKAAQEACTADSRCRAFTCTAEGDCTKRSGRKMEWSTKSHKSFVKEGADVDKPDECIAIVYDNDHFSGRNWVLPWGRYGLSQLAMWDLQNDVAQSIIVHGNSGCSVTIYEHDGYWGWKVTLKEGKYRCADIVAKGGKCKDLSSMKVWQGYPYPRRLKAGETTSVVQTSRQVLADLKKQRPVGVVEGRRLRASGLKVPDGWTAFVGTKPVCTSEYRTKQVKSQFDYDHSSSFSLNPAGFRLDIGGFSFGMSMESSEFRKGSSKYKKAMFDSTVECVDYVAEISDIEGSAPPVSESFKFAVESLQGESDYYQLFDLFGLQFPKKVVFGARYGLRQTITESSFEAMSTKESSFSISGEYTKGLPKASKKAGASASVTVGGGYKEKESEQSSEASSEYFEDRKEFSLGKRMHSGGVEEWVEDIGDEPMPVRYGLVSLCEHPALKSKKQDCEAFSKTYCSNHLSQFQDVNCVQAEPRECMWDIDCPDAHTCSDEGACVEEPSCTVFLFEDSNKNMEMARQFGPLYHKQVPQGHEFEVGKNTKVYSFSMSGGCEEVILMDGDEGQCSVDYEGNGVWDNREANDVKAKDLVDDLRDDVCRMKVFVKERYN